MISKTGFACLSADGKVARQTGETARSASGQQLNRFRHSGGEERVTCERRRGNVEEGSLVSAVFILV